MKTKLGLFSFCLSLFFFVFGVPHNSHENTPEEKSKSQNGLNPLFLTAASPQGHGDELNEGKEGKFLDDLLHARGIVYSFNDTS